MGLQVHTSIHYFDSSILRRYDIRGLVGETLTEKDAYYVGKAFGTMLESPCREVAIGRDGRLSSPAFAKALAQGVCETGCSVYDLGLVSSPILYYAVFERKCAGGVMVTGSHNPSNHNGFKLMRGQEPFFGADIMRLGILAAEGKFARGSGEHRTGTLLQEYIQRILQGQFFSPPLKVAWDASNGVMGPIVRALLPLLPFSSFLIHDEVDGRFPAHPPDPSISENYASLRALMQKEGCHIGFMFDGDGDRIGVLDDKGKIVWGDQILLLFAREILGKYPGATFIADVKTSQVFFEEVSRYGGTPIMEKTGHSIIKKRMKEARAALAGEMSGHFFFADEWYGFDDGLYAALRLLSLVSRFQCTLSALRESLPQRFSTPELYFPCADALKESAVDRLQEVLQKEGAIFSTVDGVRVKRSEGWWLLRASNTQAQLTARVEADSLEARERLQEELQMYLVQIGLAGESCA